jgi:hypothetical protein
VLGTLSRPKSDKSDFGWERGWGEGLSSFVAPVTPHRNHLPKGERARTEIAASSSMLIVKLN